MNSTMTRQNFSPQAQLRAAMMTANDAAYSLANTINTLIFTLARMADAVADGFFAALGSTLTAPGALLTGQPRHALTRVGGRYVELPGTMLAMSVSDDVLDDAADDSEDDADAPAEDDGTDDDDDAGEDGDDDIADDLGDDAE